MSVLVLCDLSYLRADKCFNLNGGTNVHGCVKQKSLNKW